MNPGILAGGNSEYGRSTSDFCPTPPEVTIALFNFLNLPKQVTIWEPACGDGDMVETICKMGYSCVGTDIRFGVDFLKEEKACDWIITNPPFSIAEEFIRHAFDIGKPFAMLLKSNYWNAKKRSRLFKEITPAWILPLTWRPDFCRKERGKGSPVLDVIWCVWDGFPHLTANYLPLEKPIVKEESR